MASISTHLHSQQQSSLCNNNLSALNANHHNNINAPFSLSFSRDFHVSRWRMSSSSATTSKLGFPIQNHNNNKNGDDNRKAVVYEKLDRWMENSVVEIVKNLREAPLLVHVYDKGDWTTLKTDKSVQEECWGVAMGKWVKKEMPCPEGVIFVEQLDEEDEDGITRAWGLVVQGKGSECGPVCYLLKTSRVAGFSGSGVCCTHYCLMRVQSFRDSAFSQLQSCWIAKQQHDITNAFI